MSDIATRVKRITSEHLGADLTDITDESDFIKDLGADSLDTVGLVMSFEEEFGIEIQDADFDTMQTVGGAIALVTKLKGA